MSVRDYLRRHDIDFTWFLHRPASTASRLAKSVHVPGRRVAKGVLLKVDGGRVLAVLPAIGRVDLARLAGLLGAREVALAEEREVGAAFPDCERGAVPPFGRLYGLPTYVDAGLACGAEEFICVGNQRHEALRLSYRDFARLEAPTVAEFAERQGRPGAGPRRIAG